MQLSGMPDNLAVDHDLGTTPRMPRQFLTCAQRYVDVGSTPDDPGRLQRVGDIGRATTSPRPARLARTGQHQRHVDRLCG
ncbi:Uncharacterised protein [Mycobacteroides abscessus subsp. abscessus]|nr:Uncharacterised protein [Mycobacteroides abscessus subsp. abscessus]